MRRGNRLKAEKKRYPDWIANPIKEGNFITDTFVSVNSFGPLEFVASSKTSCVSLAKYLNNGKFYALKGVKKKFMHQSKSFEQVRRQCEIHAGLSHRFIANAFRVFDHHSFVYIAQEYCVGGTLQMMLDRQFSIGGSLPSSSVKFYVAEISSALNYLHTKRFVIYRNLSADNIGVSWTGHIKLLGFGNACQVTPWEPMVRTFNKDILARINAQAPELIAPSLLASSKTETHHSYQVDWWALGVLIHHLLSGTFPFGDSSWHSNSTVASRIMENERSNSLRVKAFKYRQRNTGVLTLMESLLERDLGLRWGYSDILACEWLSDVGDWSSIHKRPAPFIPKWYLTEGDKTCFSASIKHRRKIHKVGVHPEEYAERPSHDQLSYCYFTHVCRDIMIQVLSNHTLRSKRALEAVNAKTLNQHVSYEQQSKAVENIKEGVIKKQQRKIREVTLFDDLK